MKQQSINDEPYEVTLPCIRVQQPLGAFYVGAIDSKKLREITFSDIRRMSGDRDIDTYLGIQREVDPKRVKEIKQYVNTIDACFPTAIILAVSAECASFDETKKELTLRSFHEQDRTVVGRFEIAKVLDGQHRIEGLGGFEGSSFEVNVSIFIDMDIADQAYLFSVVNLAQTKVKKSLVYDLFEYARSRSPQKSAHNIAIALDQLPESPLYRRIKRLGSATPGRVGETITQAAFVEALIELISFDPVSDRDTYKRGKRPARATSTDSQRLIFRDLFLDEKDMTIADIVLAFFTAVHRKWPVAWTNSDTGYVLAKTNGFKGLIRLLRPVYAALAVTDPVPDADQFFRLLNKSSVRDEDFVNTNFLPGSGGEARLFRTLHDEIFPNTGSKGLQF